MLNFIQHNKDTNWQSWLKKNRIFGCHFSTFYNIFQLDRSLYNSPCFVFLDIWWEGPCNFVVQSYVILCNTAKNWQKSFFCQSLPRWKSKKERFNTFDAIVNHVKRIDTFQNFNSVLVWCHHTIVQISVVVYKVFQKLQGDVSQNIVIFRCVKIFTDREEKVCGKTVPLPLTVQNQPSHT